MKTEILFSKKAEILFTKWKHKHPDTFMNWHQGVIILIIFPFSDNGYDGSDRSGAGEVAQLMDTLAAFAEELCLVPRIHVVTHNHR